jgi:hypothetical protein
MTYFVCCHTRFWLREECYFYHLEGLHGLMSFFVDSPYLHMLFVG